MAELVTPRLALPPPPSFDDDLDSAWDSPAPALTPQIVGGSVLSSLAPEELQALSSDDLVDDLDEDDRPSDRATVPTQLAPRRVEELSASDLDDEPESESARSLATTRPPPPSHHGRPSLQDLAFALETSHPLTLPLFNHERHERRVENDSESLHPMTAQTMPASVPPVSVDVRPPLSSLPGDTARSYPVPKGAIPLKTAIIVITSHVAVAASVLAFVWVTREPPKHVKREPRIAMNDRIGVGSATTGSVEYAAPTEGCRVQDLARIIAPRAMLGPGLDASVLESGFGVGLASTPKEAMGVRLEASTLRTAETVRVQSVWPVARVAIDRGTEAEERFQVRLDGHDTRTIAPSQRIVAAKGGVFATDDDGNTRLLWALPGGSAKTVETVRATARADGPTVVAVRRPGMFWVGVTGQGAMTSLLRTGHTLGAPALVSVSDGGLMAWAERSATSHAPFTIMTASIGGDGKRTSVTTPAPVAEGISPALANLPSGEVLLVYSDGGAGAHRIVAQRLGSDLSPLGGVMVLSETGANAGSPAVAVDADGRAIVAYLAIEKGRAEVRATALLCH